MRVMLPLSVPALATLCIIDTLNTWNEFLIALVLISQGIAHYVPVGLLQFQGEYSSHTLPMAGILISIIPVIIIFIFLRAISSLAYISGAIKADCGGISCGDDFHERTDQSSAPQRRRVAVPKQPRLQEPAADVRRRRLHQPVRRRAHHARLP